MKGVMTHKKDTCGVYAEESIRPACASAQSDQNLCSVLTTCMYPEEWIGSSAGHDGFTDRFEPLLFADM